MSALKKYSKFKSKCAYINYSKSKNTSAYIKCQRTHKQLKCMRIQFKVGVQALTIWARRALHSALLLSPAEVLVLILVLSFWRCCSSTFWSSSGICSQIRSAYMGGVSAVLARLVVLARHDENMPKCRHPRWNVSTLCRMSAPADILTISPRKSQKANFA
jgi:hypothetical protein